MNRARVTISKTDFLALLAAEGACEQSREHVEAHPSEDAEEIYNTCTTAPWLSWLVRHSGVDDQASSARWRIEYRADQKHSRYGTAAQHRRWVKVVCTEMRRRYPWSKIAAHLTA